MKSNQRQTLLVIITVSLVSLLGLDFMVVTPLLQKWRSGSEKIEKLQTTLDRGKDLLGREKTIRSRWKEMIDKDLPDDNSVAENDLYKAVSRWSRDSKTVITSLTPQWQPHDQGYKTLEIRASLTGNQTSLCRFLYELEIDPLAIRLEDFELSAKDSKGRQLTLNARFSALNLNPLKDMGTR